jgi:hypothetical protein
MDARPGAPDGAETVPVPAYAVVVNADPVTGEPAVRRDHRCAIYPRETATAYCASSAARRRSMTAWPT